MSFRSCLSVVALASGLAATPALAQNPRDTTALDSLRDRGPFVACDTARTLDGLPRADSASRPRNEWCSMVRDTVTGDSVSATPDTVAGTVVDTPSVRKPDD